jgi:hypothetical protein
LGETKTVTSTALEYRSPTVNENTAAKFDSSLEQHPIKIPVIPPTMVGVCRLMQIYYILKVSIEDERKNESLEMEFPITIATIPYRSPQTQLYSITYDFCVDYVEGGKYISPEFRLGSVYDGQPSTTREGGGGQGEITPAQDEEEEDIILYRPVYVKCIEKPKGIRGVTKDILDQKLTDSPTDINRKLKFGSQKSVNALLQPSGSHTARNELSPLSASTKSHKNNSLEQQKLLNH